MIAKFLLYFCQCRLKKSDDSKESYCKAIQLLKLKIPIVPSLPKSKELIDKYKEVFNNKPPTKKERENITRSPKYNETFRLVAIRILNSFGYIDKIKEKPMLRCIKRNLHVFAYAILFMRKEFPTEFERIKNDYFAKINNQEKLNDNNNNYQEIVNDNNNHQEILNDNNYQEIILDNNDYQEFLNDYNYQTYDDDENCDFTFGTEL